MEIKETDKKEFLFKFAVKNLVLYVQFSPQN